MDSDEAGTAGARMLRARRLRRVWLKSTRREHLMERFIRRARNRPAELLVAAARGGWNLPAAGIPAISPLSDYLRGATDS